MNQGDRPSAAPIKSCRRFTPLSLLHSNPIGTVFTTCSTGIDEFAVYVLNLRSQFPWKQLNLNASVTEKLVTTSTDARVRVEHANHNTGDFSLN